MSILPLRCMSWRDARVRGIGPVALQLKLLHLAGWGRPSLRNVIDFGTIPHTRQHLTSPNYAKSYRRAVHPITFYVGKFTYMPALCSSTLRRDTSVIRPKHRSQNVLEFSTYAPQTFPCNIFKLVTLFPGFSAGHSIHPTDIGYSTRLSCYTGRSR